MFLTYYHHDTNGVRTYFMNKMDAERFARLNDPNLTEQPRYSRIWSVDVYGVDR